MSEIGNNCDLKCTSWACGSPRPHELEVALNACKVTHQKDLGHVPHGTTLSEGFLIAL